MWRVLLTAWAVATIVSWLPLGVIRHTAVVASFFPHAKFRPVMFDRMPDTVEVVKVSSAAGEVITTKVNRTQAWGYHSARTHLNFTTHPQWLGYLCSIRPEMESSRITVVREHPAGGAREPKLYWLTCNDGTLQIER